jgi:hypothetical protein
MDVLKQTLLYMFAANGIVPPVLLFKGALVVRSGFFGEFCILPSLIDAPHCTSMTAN